MTAFALLITPAPLLFLNPEFVYLNGLELISSSLARARTGPPRRGTSRRCLSSGLLQLFWVRFRQVSRDDAS